MRTILKIVAVIILALLFVDVSEAQLFRVEDNVFVNKQLKNSAKDSTQNIPVTYTGSAFPSLKGAFPDSIRVEWRASADSVYAIDLYLEVRDELTTTINRTYLDSIKSTSAAITVGGVLLSYTKFQGQKYIGILGIARASGNAANTATASKIVIRVARYFRLN